MNRIDRLHAMLTHLQSKKKVTASEMAGRFRISLRTVYRDIKALEGSGVPVIGEAGSGYTIMEGYRLPPVMFTQEEASALMLGAKLAERFTDSCVRRHYAAALFKIKAVLRSADKEYIDDLTDHIEVSAAHTAGMEGAQQNLSAVQQAIVQKKVLHLAYHAGAGSREAQTLRDVEPIGLWYYGSAWHMIAWCRLRKGYRDFRLSRMQRILIRDEVFDGDAHPSIRDYVRQIMERNQLQEAVIRIDSRAAKFIQEQKLLQGFVSQEDMGHSIRMVFLVGCLDYFGRWLLTLTDAVSVESPVALQQVMSGLAERIHARHGRYLTVSPV
ncbi:MAG: YafY family protein [Bacteroidota bacterium]|nr:YafY family protein [Bacteroidota bacterium]